MIVRSRARAWAYVVIFAVLAGCTRSVGRAPDVDTVNPKLVLNEGEFRVVGIVRGQASCPFLLYLPEESSLWFLAWMDVSERPIPLIGFALGDPALHLRAMEDLHSKHDLLGKPQILHNFLEEWTVANYLGLFAIQRLTITAEVLEFTGVGP